MSKNRILQTFVTTDIFHVISWFAGILCLLVPYFSPTSLKIIHPDLQLRLGSGHFADNILILLGVVSAGAIAGGYSWRFAVWIKGAASLPLKLASIALLLLGIIGLSIDVSTTYHFPVGSSLLLIALCIAFFSRSNKQRLLPKLGSLKDWLLAKNPINSVYFLVFYLIILVNNGVAIFGLDSSFLEKFSAFIGRALFYAGAICAFTLLLELLLRATPKVLRGLVWLQLGLLPFIAVADLWSITSLGRPVRGFINSFTTHGDFEIMTFLKAGGLDISQAQTALLAIAILLTAGSVSYLCWRISILTKHRYSLPFLFILALITTVSAIAEQGIGSMWKRRSAWQAEHKALPIQLGIYAPPKGVGNYKVQFFETPELLTTAPKATKRPDIYVIMVESMRADAMRQNITPFLLKFAKEDCQQYGSTWSGSNATHLSWFSMMHSQLPIYWKRDLEAIPNKDTYKGAAPLQWMKHSGYNIEVRAVCDLSYMNFGLLNFGAGNQLASVVEQSVDGTKLASLDIPEREVLTFDRLKKSLLKNGAGGNFYYTALDSPHYGYYWHPKFEVPIQKYIGKASFPLRPSQDEVTLYHNRYLNSCAWVDHQVKEFCEFLKKEGRYDESIIIVTGDHGEEFQEHGRWCHCSSLFPEQTKVPLLIKWPKSHGKTPTKNIASHLDVMPSLLHYLGAPTEVTQGLVGHNLLTEGQHHTAISTTAFAGNTGETMVLRRGKYTAYFSWPSYWLAGIPTEMSLERIEEDGKLIHLESAQEYKEKLKELFPDAFENYIKSLTVIE